MYLPFSVWLTDEAPLSDDYSLSCIFGMICRDNCVLTGPGFLASLNVVTKYTRTVFSSLSTRHSLHLMFFFWYCIDSSRGSILLKKVNKYNENFRKHDFTMKGLSHT